MDLYRVWIKIILLYTYTFYTAAALYLLRAIIFQFKSKVFISGYQPIWEKYTETLQVHNHIKNSQTWIVDDLRINIQLHGMGT